MPSHDPIVRRPPSLFAPGSLILLPVALLSVLALLSLRNDRTTARLEAREACQQAADRIATTLASTWTSDQSTTAGVARFTLSPDGHLTDPTPYDPVPRPAPESDAYRRYKRLSSLHDTDRHSRVRGLAELVAEQPDARTPAGLPLVPIAEQRRLLLLSTAGIEAIARQKEVLAEAAIRYPSSITPDLLREAGSEPALDTWARQETARAIAARFTGAGRLTPPAWVDHAGTSWHVSAPLAGGVHAAASAKHLSDHLLTFLSAPASPVPGYADFSVSCTGRRLTPEIDAADPPVFAAATAGPFAVEIFLTNPEKLYAPANTRALWIAATVLAAALVAMAGFVAVRRSLLAQHRLNTQKDNFVSSVSHELRTPIASVQLMAESLAADRVTTDAKRHEYYGLIGAECRRLGSLVENVLDDSRIQTGRSRFEFSPTDLGALVDAAGELMRTQAAQKDIEVQTSTPGSPVDATVDPGAITRAIVNLLDNAIKYSPSRSTVSLALTTTDGGHQITVSDHGPGIPKADQPQVFDRFFRAGSELTRETQGTGIGLSIVRHIARAHRGTATLTDSSDHGSTFTITLPDD